MIGTAASRAPRVAKTLHSVPEVEAVDLVIEGENPKDVADVLRRKYRYDGLHAKTVANWHRKYPLGKSPKTLPPRVVDEIREVVQGLDQEERRRDMLASLACLSDLAELPESDNLFLMWSETTP